MIFWIFEISGFLKDYLLGRPLSNKIQVRKGRRPCKLRNSNLEFFERFVTFFLGVKNKIPEFLAQALFVWKASHRKRLANYGT